MEMETDQRVEYSDSTRGDDMKQHEDDKRKLEEAEEVRAEEVKAEEVEAEKVEAEGIEDEDEDEDIEDKSIPKAPRKTPT